VLEEALRHFAGSVVLISHDRYFMSQVANTIFSFHNRTVGEFPLLNVIVFQLLTRIY